MIKEKKMDWFSVYMNAYTEVLIHTPIIFTSRQRRFDVSFKREKIGIGATIQEKKEKKIGTLVVGAPAWKSKQISEGDEILKVKSKKTKNQCKRNGYVGRWSGAFY